MNRNHLRIEEFDIGETEKGDKKKQKIRVDINDSWEVTEEEFYLSIGER